jgi:hypothetical protein
MIERGMLLCALMLAAFILAPAQSLALTTEALEEAGVSLSGYLEAEASYVDAAGEETSDLAVSEVTLAVEYAPNDWLFAAVVFLYEDGSDGVEVDEAYASVGGSTAVPVVFTAGRLYLPIGAYSSEQCSGVLCTDSLTQSLSEAQEDVLQVSYGFDAVTVLAGFANGDVDEVGEDNQVQLFYGAVEVSPVNGLMAGVAYVSSLADSEELSALAPEEGITEKVAGLSVYVIYAAGRFYGQAEYVTALARFEPADLDADGDGSGDQPEAFNIEFGYAVLDDLQLGARYAASREFGEFAETQYGAVANYELFDGAVVSLEYLHNELPDGTDEDRVTGRLAVEF